MTEGLGFEPPDEEPYHAPAAVGFPTGTEPPDGEPFGYAGDESAKPEEG